MLQFVLYSSISCQVSGLVPKKSVDKLNLWKKVRVSLQTKLCICMSFPLTSEASEILIRFKLPGKELSASNALTILLFSEGGYHLQKKLDHNFLVRGTIDD